MHETRLPRAWTRTPLAMNDWSIVSQIDDLNAGESAS